MTARGAALGAVVLLLGALPAPPVAASPPSPPEERASDEPAPGGDGVASGLDEGAATPAAPVRAAAPRDPVAAAIQQTFDATTRKAGIAALERLWPGAADRSSARHALARALSWERRLDEALTHYDALVRERPSPDLEVALERLQILSWQGRVAEAEAGYLTLVAGYPHSAAAHVGLARMRHWQGRPLAALEAARRAVALAPADGPAREELASAYLALGLPHAARDAIAGASTPKDEVTAAIARARRLEQSTAAVASADSFGVERLALRAKLAWRAAGDVRIELGGGSSHLRRTGEALDYGVAGVALSLARPRVELGASAAAYGGTGLLLSEAGVFATVRAHEQLRLTLGGRRRPLLEAAEPLATGEAAFFAAGSAGATTLAAVARRGVDELRIGLNGSARRGVYAYADGRAMRLTDGNVGYSTAGGLGADVLALVGLDVSVSLVARADSFAVGYRDARPDYFSPPQLDGHVVGGQLIVRLDHLVVSANAGATFSLGQMTEPGWTAGGGLEGTFGRFSIMGRVERRDDIAYASRRAWLAIVMAL